MRLKFAIPVLLTAIFALAAEPVTHRPDALNPNGDPRDQGMTILRPGEALEGTIDILVTP